MPMACLNKYNNEQQGYCSAMGPRISFSNDFADAKQALKQEINCYTEAPVSSDFEFSLPANPVNPADELSFKGKLLPLKQNCNNSKVMTLRDELLAEDDDSEFPRLSKNLGWWRINKLRLKRNYHIAPKKSENGGLERIEEAKKSVFLPDKFINMTGSD